MTGVYLNNSFLTKGQSGFAEIDYNNGKVYFSSPVTGILSGNYAIKDFNVESTHKTEQDLLTETNFYLRPQTNQNLTGLPDNSIGYPCILLKNKASTNEPFQFGGTVNTKIHLSAYIFADSAFKVEAIAGIIRDSKEKEFGLLDINEAPYNFLGGLKTGYYDYNSLSYPKILNNSGGYICETKTIQFGSLLSAEFKRINPKVFTRVIDIEIGYVREPHT